MNEIQTHRLNPMITKLGSQSIILKRNKNFHQEKKNPEISRHMSIMKTYGLEMKFSKQKNTDIPRETERTEPSKSLVGSSASQFSLQYNSMHCER